MFNKKDKNQARQVRHLRVRNKISGTPERPRLNVYRSLNEIYAQVIDDVNGKTLAVVQRWTRNCQNSWKAKTKLNKLKLLVLKLQKEQRQTRLKMLFLIEADIFIQEEFKHWQMVLAKAD